MTSDLRQCSGTGGTPTSRARCRATAQGPGLSRRSMMVATLGAVGMLLLRATQMVRAASEPASALRAAAFAKLGAVIEAAIAAGNTPGAVLCLGRGAGVVYLKAFGKRAVE